MVLPGFRLEKKAVRADAAGKSELRISLVKADVTPLDAEKR